MLLNFVIPIVAALIVMVLSLCLIEYVMRHLVKRAYAGPEELTSLFIPVARKKRAFHTVPFKMMVLEEVQKNGMDWTVARYHYLDLQPSVIKQWQRKYYGEGGK